MLYKLRCPKCNAAASLPLTYLYSRVAADKPGDSQPNVLCISCRHRWHTPLRFHAAI